MTILPLTTTHWPMVHTIYEESMATGNATFTTKDPAWDVWNNHHLSHSRLVAHNEAEPLLSWAVLSSVSNRCVYGGVGEVSVYVGPAARGQSVDQQLLAALITESEANGNWTRPAGIISKNIASVHIHAEADFREVGRREHIGQHYGVRRDTLLVERRSAVVGATPLQPHPSFNLIYR